MMIARRLFNDCMMVDVNLRLLCAECLTLSLWVLQRDTTACWMSSWHGCGKPQPAVTRTRTNVHALSVCMRARVCMCVCVYARLRACSTCVCAYVSDFVPPHVFAMCVHMWVCTSYMCVCVRGCVTEGVRGLSWEASASAQHVRCGRHCTIGQIHHMLNGIKCHLFWPQPLQPSACHMMHAMHTINTMHSALTCCLILQQSSESWRGVAARHTDTVRTCL